MRMMDERIFEQKQVVVCELHICIINEAKRKHPGMGLL